LFEKQRGTGQFNNDFTNSLLNRDKGLFDNIPFSSWFATQPLAKKQVYDRCMQQQIEKRSSPQEDSFLRALQSVLGLEVTGLLLEVADEQSPASVSLGAAVLLARSEVAPQLSLSSSAGSDVMRGLREAEGRREACLVACHADELVQLARFTQRPVFIQKRLFDAVCIDADLEQRDTGDMLISGTAAAAGRGSGGQDQGSPKAASPAWSLFNADLFLPGSGGMSTSEKRAVLRASGVEDLPRPRQGQAALDNALLTVMDSAVRQEVLRRRSLPPSSSSSSSASASASGAGAGRAALLRGMAEALEQGDEAAAERLRDEFARKTVLRQDPTQDEGSYSRFLDQDDWYYEARRRAMAPKQKKEDS
jgi:hypothetical protein